MGLRDGCARLWDRDQPLLQWRCPCGCLGSPALWVSTPDLPSVPATGVPGLSEGPWNPVWARPPAQGGGTVADPLLGLTSVSGSVPQDTCVALQALAEYAILSYAGGVNLTVSLASTNLDYQETFELHRGNQKLLQMAAVRVPRTGVGGQGSESGPSSLPVCPRVSAGGQRGTVASSLPRSPASPRGCL